MMRIEEGGVFFLFILLSLYCNRFSLVSKSKASHILPSNPNFTPSKGEGQDDRVEIIPNEQGNRTTPSYVAITDCERLIGDVAKNQVAMNPTNTVFDAKRLIGRRFSDACVQSDIKLWPFKAVSGAAEKPLISVNYKGQEKTFAAENKITVVKGNQHHLSEEEIKLLVPKNENAKMALENYVYNMRNAARDETIAAKLSPCEKQMIEDVTSEVIAWLDSNQLGEAHEFEDKMNELDNVCNLIIAEIFHGGAADDEPAHAHSGGCRKKKIIEVD